MKTKTLYWILGAWLTLLLVMALAGCRTKSVTEYVVTHDTLRVTSTDIDQRRHGEGGGGERPMAGPMEREDGHGVSGEDRHYI